MPFNSAPTPSQPGNCVDSPLDWFDSDGSDYNCEWYEENGHCVTSGDDYANNGITANMACCACGGGSTNGTPSPTPATTPAPTPDDSQNCPSGESLFKMTIKTGRAGSDTKFIVKKRQNGWQRVMIGGNDGDRFPNYMEIVRKECLPTNGCYKVIVKDSAGDGMGLGWYKFSWKGQFMKIYIFH